MKYFNLLEESAKEKGLRINKHYYIVGYQGEVTDFCYKNSKAKYANGWVIVYSPSLQYLEFKTVYANTKGTYITIYGKNIYFDLKNIPKDD